MGGYCIRKVTFLGKGIGWPEAQDQVEDLALRMSVFGNGR